VKVDARDARRRGCGWRDLGEDLGLSAHGVRKRHLAVDPIYAWRSSGRRESDE